jgi:CBS domain-containing protein
MLLPLLLAVTVAHGFTVLVLRRSILTEKIARRGYHLSREYAIDPLEILFVREVMRTSIAALPADAPYEILRRMLRGDGRGDDARTLRPPRTQRRQSTRAADTAKTEHTQRLYPVVGESQELLGVVTRRDLQDVAEEAPADLAAPLAAIIKTKPIVAYPDESLRMIVYRMAETGLTRFPVVSRERGRLIGMIALTDLLKARALNLDAERRRERVLGAHIALPFGWKHSGLKSQI